MSIRHRRGRRAAVDPVSRQETFRRLWIVANVQRARAAHALQQAGLPVPTVPANTVALHDANMICPRCGAELLMPIGEDGWFCVLCGDGWAAEWHRKEVST